MLHLLFTMAGIMFATFIWIYNNNDTFDDVMIFCGQFNVHITENFILLQSGTKINVPNCRSSLNISEIIQK